jgi:methanogenic corrinoid protein MtbC1
LSVTDATFQEHQMGRGRAGRTHDAFPLRLVSGQTGLTPDVIRAWEKRYRVVAPVRGPRGARLYSREDITHLRLLARVVATGRAIGDVARLDREHLETLAGDRDPARAVSDRTVVLDVLRSLERFDAAAVGRQLGDALAGLGARRFVFEVAVPLVAEIGERWSDGRLSVAEEHLLSAGLRSLLIGVIQHRREARGPTLVLATVSGERHEIGLLLVALLAADTGLRLVYLGTDLPAGEIVAAARRSGASIVGLGAVTSENRPRAMEEIRAVEHELGVGVALWLGGRDARAILEDFDGCRALVFDDLGLVDVELSRTKHDGPVG